MTGHSPSQPIISGPCIICGGTNYDLSCGGPTICPKCDCGQFDAATVMTQSKAIASLRAKVNELTARVATLPKPETLLAYASILEKPQYVIKNGVKFPIATGEIVEAACAALRFCAALAIHSQHSDGEAGR